MAPTSLGDHHKRSLGFLVFPKADLMINLRQLPGGLIAAIEEPAVIVRILTNLGMPARAPPQSAWMPSSLTAAL